MTELAPVSSGDPWLLDGGLLTALALDGLIRADSVRVTAGNSWPEDELARIFDFWANGLSAPQEVHGRQPEGGWLAQQLMPHDFVVHSHALWRLRAKRSRDAGGGRSEDGIDGVLDALFLAVPMGIWSSVDGSLLDFVQRTTRALGEADDVAVTSMATAVIVQQNTLSGNFARAFDQVDLDFESLGLMRSATLSAMDAGLALAHPAISPEEVETLGRGDTPASALAIAVCAVRSAETSFDEALRIAVNHSGDSAVTGALAGAIMGGSFGGMQGIDGRWLDRLAGAEVLHRLAQDACEQFGPSPRVDPEWRQRYPVLGPAEGGVEAAAGQEYGTSPQPRTNGPRREAATGQRARVTVLGSGSMLEKRRNRVCGAVLGFAIGDRLGSAVEDLPWSRIRRRYGNRGIVRYAPAETDVLRASLVRLALSVDTVIKADRLRVAGETPRLGQDLVQEYDGVAAALAARERPAFSNYLVAEAAWMHQLDPRLEHVLVGPESSGDDIARYLPLALWAEIHPQAFALAREAASAGSADAEDAVSIAAFVVMVQQCIVTKNPPRAYSTAEAELNKLGSTEVGTALAQALRIAREGITPEEIEQLGSGNTAAEAIAIAVCAAESAPFQFDEALRIAVNHSGNSAVTGALCGALMGGSFDGVESLPPQWLDGLTGGHMLYRLAQDAGDQLGPAPRDDLEWRQRYPVSSDPAGAETQESPDPQPQQAPDAHERFMGSVLAAAVGDALGYAIEFHDIVTIRRHHGDCGLTEPVLREGLARVSDETQMMLFTLEGLIRAHVARRMQPTDNDPVPEVQHAYQRWFHTQNQPWERAAGPYVRQLPRPDGWLITNEDLFSVRAPGNTCMSALANFARTHQHATPTFKINDSKGCGGVMRAGPVAVWSNDPAEVFEAGADTAALTHSHPSGFLSAGFLAVIVHQVIRDVPLTESVRLARELLMHWPGHEEQLWVLDKAVDLARRGPVGPEELTDTLGQGWVGEEALAIGLYAVMATDTLREALLLSVNHSGDSDSTGTVCGTIGGAVHGSPAIPHQWLSVLELRDVIQTLAQDALAEFSPAPPTESSWAQRYPAW